MKKIVYLLIILQVSFIYAQMPINQEIKDGIILMREEEKFARDVYLELYDIWNMEIFKNIAGSEQLHMESVKGLIERYKLEDPIKSDERGEFKSLYFKNLYKTMVTQGTKSQYDALYIGATIEDLDLYDLNEQIALNSNADILRVYNSLKSGSINHIRAFSKQLKKYGNSYQARFNTQLYLDQYIK